MKELPVLFTKDNRVKAVAGDKTQTRRVVTVPWAKGKRVAPYEPYYVETDGKLFYMDACGDYRPMEERARYQVGDLLWMLEPYQVAPVQFQTRRTQLIGHYADDDRNFNVCMTDAEMKRWRDRKKPYMKTSARYMYRSLARHWFEVTGLGCERVQDISGADAIAEGIGEQNRFGSWPYYGPELAKYVKTPSESFGYLWDSINKDRGHGWDKNDWVFKYVFRRAVGPRQVSR